MTNRLQHFLPTFSNLRSFSQSSSRIYVTTAVLSKTYLGRNNANSRRKRLSLYVPELLLLLVRVSIPPGPETWETEAIHGKKVSDLELGFHAPVIALHVVGTHSVCPAAHSPTRSDRALSLASSVRWNNSSTVAVPSHYLCIPDKGRHTGKSVQ